MQYMTERYIKWKRDESTVPAGAKVLAVIDAERTAWLAWRKNKFFQYERGEITVQTWNGLQVDSTRRLDQLDEEFSFHANDSRVKPKQEPAAISHDSHEGHTMSFTITTARVITGIVGQVVFEDPNENTTIVWQSAPMSDNLDTDKNAEELAYGEANRKLISVVSALFD